MLEFSPPRPNTCAVVSARWSVSTPSRLLYLAHRNTQRSTAVVTARFIKILLDFTVFLSATANTTRKVKRVSPKTLAGNPTPQGSRLVVHLAHVLTVRSMPTRLFSHQVLIHTYIHTGWRWTTGNRRRYVHH